MNPAKRRIYLLKNEIQGEYFDNPYNTIWYEVDGGYVHSAPIMPVEANYQKPIYEVPAEGRLAEVSVPDNSPISLLILTPKMLTASIMKQHIG